MSSREQLFNTIASKRCDDAKLGRMRADRIDHRGLLADEEEVTGAMEHASHSIVPRKVANSEPADLASADVPLNTCAPDDRTQT
jgi:hypothetical protein